MLGETLQRGDPRPAVGEDVLEQLGKLPGPAASTDKLGVIHGSDLPALLKCPLMLVSQFLSPMTAVHDPLDHMRVVLGCPSGDEEGPMENAPVLAPTSNESVTATDFPAGPRNSAGAPPTCPVRGFGPGRLCVQVTGTIVRHLTVSNWSALCR
jgi:hypothetical protein